MRAQFETVTAGQATALSVAGIAIRYGFYAIGMLVLGLIGIGILAVWRIEPRPVDAQPAFRLAASELARYQPHGHVVTGAKIGRVEVMQYGRLSNRETDLTAVMVMPPRQYASATQFVQDLRNANLLQLKRARFTSIHYDLETRFGEYRATEMRVDTDGRWKQCLAFRSRFDTPAVYLTGWYCDGTGSKPSAASLACMLDRLVIDGDLASKEASSFLRERMANRARCQADPVSQTTDTGHRGVSPPSRWSRPSALHRY